MTVGEDVEEDVEGEVLEREDAAGELIWILHLLSPSDRHPTGRSRESISMEDTLGLVVYDATACVGTRCQCPEVERVTPCPRRLATRIETGRRPARLDVPVARHEGLTSCPSASQLTFQVKASIQATSRLVAYDGCVDSELVSLRTAGRCRP